MAGSAPLTHQGPAGTAYSGIEHAGRSIVANYYKNFPQSTRSFIAPPMFKVTYPEKHDKNTGEMVKAPRKLTSKEEGRFLGMKLNDAGETSEYIVYQAFEKLVQRSNLPPTFILRGLQLDKNVPAKESGGPVRDWNNILPETDESHFWLIYFTAANSNNGCVRC